MNLRREGPQEDDHGENYGDKPGNQGDGEKQQKVAVRQARILVWGPIYITLNLEKTPKKEEGEAAKGEKVTAESQPMIERVDDVQKSKKSKKKDSKSSINVLTETPDQTTDKPEPTVKQEAKQQADNSKKITYVYNIIDHGLDCECIDVKGELLIRSALPTYRKISQGIEFEQITSNQIKLIVTSRVLENYQEVFQGFSQPKATFRIWVIGYKFV